MLGGAIAANGGSRQHCDLCLVPGTEDTWTVMDLGSSSGTSVNGKLAEARTGVRVSVGDRIQVGPVLPVFEAWELLISAGFESNA